ncbi:MAG: hypothetical protein ABJM29_20530 [Rhizobiaceae bacterium]
MAYTDHTTKTSIFIPGPQDLFRAARKWARRQQKRREVAQLLKQEDWALMDMGITRGDVREALSFKGDASLHLRALAARRRFWARQTSRL